MKEIICPNCNTAFQVDDSNYAAILSQIRNKEFNEEIHRRLKELEEQQKIKEEALQAKAEKNFQEQLAEKNREIGDLKNTNTRLEGEKEAFNAKLKADITSAVAEKERKISSLKVKLAEMEQDIKLKVLEAQNAGKSEIHEKESKILELEARIKADKYAAETKELQIRELHKQQLADKQEEIDRLRDFKLKLSTKMVGETLEQHCQLEFNRAKSFGMFPDATFEKDNIAAEGTKGDFIFRDFVDGNEFVSIMFEMKNESDTTATKHKNEHFFDKLDKDRRKKNCEFAVLVSMLEQGNDMYDAGIVDVSYLYPKMLVIRPQFFLPIIRLVSEGAKKGFIQNRELMAELELARNETRDFSKFEERIENFTKTFGRHVKGAHDKFVAATEGIDKIISNLEKQIELLRGVKKNFQASEERLLKADTYVQADLTVRKLTHGAPLVRKMIQEASTDSSVPDNEE